MQTKPARFDYNLTLYNRSYIFINFVEPKGTARLEKKFRTCWVWWNGTTMASSLEIV